jgi:Protein of unknown function (DUF3052)
MSEKPIAERLQVKNGRRLAVIGAPATVDQEIGVQEFRASSDRADVVLVFAKNHAALKASLPNTLAVIRDDAILWLAYPKLTSPLAGDLHRDVVREAVPNYGLDTVSQIAIDTDWSALRLKRVAR